jgi:ubiquinone biosynthesis protein UbiJ
MLKAPLAFALNHLLDNASWARERLAPFAGQTLALQAGPWRLTFIVTQTGRFQAHPESGAESGVPAAVSVILPPDALFLLFADNERLLQQAKISGNVDFAECLNFVFRNLEWDVEADLAALIGDIPARRLTLLGNALRARLRQTAERLAANVSEYLRDEAECLVSSRQIKRFAADIQDVSEKVAQLEKRLQALAPRQ